MFGICLVECFYCYLVDDGNLLTSLSIVLLCVFWVLFMFESWCDVYVCVFCYVSRMWLVCCVCALVCRAIFFYLFLLVFCAVYVTF